MEVDDLKDRLTFTRQELKNVYENYCKNKALCEAYQDMLSEM